MSAWSRRRKSSERATVWFALEGTGEVLRKSADYADRLFVCGDQSGRTSAPTRPQAVQIILGHKERTGTSSGSSSAFMIALWWHHPDVQ
jgi:hypothetical protein